MSAKKNIVNVNRRGRMLIANNLPKHQPVFSSTPVATRRFVERIGKDDVVRFYDNGKPYMFIPLSSQPQFVDRLGD